MPLSEQAQYAMASVYNAFVSMGADVAIDKRRLPAANKFERYARAGTEFILGIADDNLAKDQCQAGYVNGNRLRSVPIRDGVNYILSLMGMDDLPFDCVLPGDSMEAPAPEVEAETGDAAPNGLPITAWMDRRREPEPEAEDDDGEIPSWDMDDQSWMGCLGKSNLATINKMKSEWRLSGRVSCPVFYDGRVYLRVTAMAKANGLVTSNVSRALKAGQTRYGDKPLGYAIPAIDAIRRGLTRKEFAMELMESDGEVPEPPAVDPGPANPQPSAADAKPEMGDLIEAAKKEANGAAGKKEQKVVAVLIEDEDGNLAYDRDFDFETAQRVIEHCAKVAKKAARVSL